MGNNCSKNSHPDRNITLEEAVAHVKRTPFSQYLDDETIKGFSRCFLGVSRCLEGSRIELEGDRLYIVATGEIDLSTAYPDHTKVEASGYLCRKKAGDIINLRHIQEDARRRASSNSHKINDLVEEIRATANGKDEILLLCANMQELESFLALHPELSATIKSLSTTSIEDKLSQIPFLQPLPPSKINLLAAMCRYEAFDSKCTVFEQDDKADKLYLILSGVAEVIATESAASRGLHAMTSKRHLYSEVNVALQRSLECSCKRQTLLQSSEIVIAQLHSGDYFGETALCLDLDRTCKVRTLEKSLLLTVSKTDFKNFLNICPIEDLMTNVVKQRLLSKLSTLGIPFLNGITDDMFTSLTDAVEINEVPQDYVVFRQGDVGDTFFIVVHGSVDVVTNAETAESDEDETGSRLGSLGPGAYFGEMALISAENNLRSATVTSTKKSVLLSIGKDKFINIFGSNPQVLAEFELRILRRRAKLGNILKHSLGLTSFRDYLEKEHAGENIDFLVATTQFSQEFSQMTKDEKLAKAKNIFVTFCAEYADRQINLPHNIMHELDNDIHNSDDVSRDIFDASRSEIIMLLERDNFGRYKSSQEFKDYFSMLGIL